MEKSEAIEQLNSLFMLIVGDKKEMDQFFLTKFVKDFELIDEKVSSNEIDEIFNQLCLSENVTKKSINFESF